MIGFLNVAIGSVLLLVGRKLFWLLVGAIGFLIGLEVATRITLPSQLMLIVVTLGLGLIFALMAVFLESVAIGLAGFLGGGLVLMRIATMLGFDGTPAQVLAFILGGIVGVILVVWLFNWALITISSAAGASMIVAGLPLRPTDRPVLFLVLLILGVLLQSLTLRRERKSTKPKPILKEEPPA